MLATRAGAQRNSLGTVLDTVAMDVLERGCDRDEALHRIREANADPEAYLQHGRWDRARRAVLAIFGHPIRGSG